jgi:hypothetical protein
MYGLKPVPFKAPDGGRPVYQEWKTKKPAATRQTPAAAWFQRRCSPK